MKVFLRYFFLSFLLLFLSCNFLNATQCPHCIDLHEDCLTSRTHGGGSTGKWKDDVTPKRGWTCIYAEDLGQGNTVLCQMCEVEQVRYLHHMTYGDQLPINLSVGCICSGHMEGRLDTPEFINTSVAAAQRRTADLENRATRRANFPNLANWKFSKNGNTYIKKDGHHIIMVHGKFGGYSAIIDGVMGDQWLDTMELAKLAAFDRLYPARINAKK